MKRIKEFFQLKNWKRWFILGFTTIASVVAIVFGSMFYVSKDVNKSIEYGGGVEVVVRVLDKDGKNLDMSNSENKKLVSDVSDATADRLSGGIGLNGTKTQVEGDDKIKVTKNGALTDQELSQFVQNIQNKLSLTLTDVNMRPLFVREGSYIKFNREIDDANNPINVIDYNKLSNYTPPIRSGSASSRQTSVGHFEVEVGLKEDETAEAEWTKATKYISEQQNKTILMWLNLGELHSIATSEQNKEKWDKAKHNLYNYVHVGESIISENPNIKPTLKVNELNAKKYLVSAATVQRALSGNKFTISGEFTKQESSRLASDINFGTSDYRLKFESNNNITSNSDGSNNFNHAIWAGLVVFIIIAIFMIINYGVLGVISTLSIALYMFFTLLIFKSLNGEYSPATIAALIIGIGISVDANIITYERLKNELVNGDSLLKASRNAHKYSLSSILDANITTLIISIILFYFGSITIKSFSISLMLSIVFTLFIMLIFNKFLATLVIGAKGMGDRLYLFGVWKKPIPEGAKDENGNLITRKIPFYKKWDYVKLSNIMSIVSISIIAIMIAVFIGLAVSSNSIGGAFNLSSEFSGGTKLVVNAKTNFKIPEAVSSSGSAMTANNITTYMKEYFAALLNDPKYNLSSTDILELQNAITVHSRDAANTDFSVIFQTSKQFNNLEDLIKNLSDNLTNTYNDASISTTSISNTEAAKLVENALKSVGISFIGVIIYTLFRMKWTYSIAAIVALFHDTIFVIGCFVIMRLQMSPIIVAAILSIVAFSINDTIVIFDRIKETIYTHYPNNSISKDQLKDIINNSISETIKRSIFTSITTLLSIIVLISFKDATQLTFNLAMLIGLVIGTYSSIFIATQVWYRLEILRQKGITRRVNNNYWNVNHPSEQIFPGINDFRY